MPVSWVSASELQFVRSDVRYDSLSQFLRVNQSMKPLTVFVPFQWKGSMVVEAIWYKIQLLCAKPLTGKMTAGADIEIASTFATWLVSHPADGQSDGYIPLESEIGEWTWTTGPVKFSLAAGETCKSFVGYAAVELSESRRSVSGATDELDPTASDAKADQVTPWISISGVDDSVEVRLFAVGVQARCF